MRSFARPWITLAVFAVATLAHGATYVVPTDEALIRKTDAIVIARALDTFVESGDRGIETVTVFAIEEVLKGDRAIRSGFSIRVPGGAYEFTPRVTRFKVVPGTPKFKHGERVLLFAMNVGDGDYAVTDLALGLFGFATDDVGNRVLVRAETEIAGWDPDGTVHREPRRHADRFLDYIRNVSRQRNVEANYTIEARPLVGESASIRRTSARRVETAACNGCTVTQYTLPNGAENAQGFRWKTFPVSWNRGSAATNAPNNGSDSMTNAFTQWATGSSVSMSVASTNSNLNGINAAADGVNNVVFEENMTGIGVSAYSCASGGVLGLGGVTQGFFDATNTVNGETFIRTAEGDVSMNQGVNACIGGTLSIGNFNSAMTHEIGHSLGFRHTDKSRDNSVACTNFPAYDCESSAIMTASLTGGLNGALQAWDLRAVAALYPPTGGLAAPTGVSATATGATTVAISWTAPGGASGSTVYQVHRSINNSAFSQVCTATHPTVTCNDTTASASTAYVYKVRAGSTGTFSAIDLASTTSFTDPTLTAGVTTVKDEHVTELRTMIDKVRAITGLGGGTYSAVAGGTTVQRSHITEMRTALDAGRAALVTAGCSGCGAISYTDSTITLNVTPVKAVHFTQLRGGLN